VLPAFGNSQDLSDIEGRLAKAPDDVSLLFARACTLDMLGRDEPTRCPRRHHNGVKLMKVLLFLGSALYVSVATYLAGRFLIGRSLVGSGELILPAVIMAPAALIAGLVKVQLPRAFVAYIVLCATCIAVSTLTTPGESFFDLTGLRPGTPHRSLCWFLPRSSASFMPCR
jgi:hypothetical protein